MNRTGWRTRHIFTGLLVCCLALLAVPARADKGPAKYHKVVSIEGITEYKLDNGFRYLLFPDPSSSTVTINLTVFVGSRHEGYGETGMAHLLEHMLFKGSRLYPNADKALQEHGAEANGTTWLDRTNYYETMPATDANLEFGIRFEADRLLNCFIRREDLKSEMTVVRNEFERNENNPETILSQRMMAVAYEWHNYGKSTIGNRADIERVPIDRLQAFYRVYYQPDNVMLAIAGKFDQNKAHDYIAKYFAPLPRPKRTLQATYTEEPAQDGERTVMLRRVGKVAATGVVYHIPAAAHKDYAAVEVLETILGDSPSGRLYKALVEKKKATRVSGGSYALHDPGALEFLARVDSSSTPEEVRDIMTRVMEDFTSSPATKEEVERAKRKLLALRERALTKSKNIAIELSEWAAAGDWRLMFLHRDRVAKVTPEDVDRVAAAYLKRSNRTVGIYVPEMQVARAEIPPPPNLEELFQNYKGGEAVAAGEVFDPTPANIEKRVKRTTLPGGLKVALLPKKTRGETVVARMTLHFGNEKSLAGNTMAAQFVGAMLTRGTEKYTRQQIQDQLDKLGATLSVSGSTGQLIVSLQAKYKTLPAVLDLLSEILRHPTFPEKEFDILKRASKQSLEKSLVEPGALASRAMQRKLSPYPKEDVRYIPTLQESIERTNALTRDQVVKLYKEQIGASVGELALVGDFEPAGALKQVQALVAGWKAGVPFARIAYTPKLDVPGSRETINTPDKENAVYLAGYLLTMKDTSPDYPAVSLANYRLGGSGLSSLLADQLRQKQGLSYSVGARLSVEALDDYSQFYIFAICNPENIDKADTAVLDVLHKALKQGITAAELAEAKNGYLEEEKVSRSSDGSLASLLREGLYLDRTFDYYANVEAQIAKLSVEEVNRAVRTYIQPNRLVIVRAGDMAKAGKAPPK